jgi:hypothetical protein
MIPKTVRLHLEPLEPRLVPTFYNVGPDQTYAALHDVPWQNILPGDTVRVFWAPTPYHDKIQLWMRGNPVSHIQIIGVPDAGGDLPVLDAAGAIEMPQADYLNNQVTAQAIITIVPTGNEGFDYKAGWIDIANLELENATRGNYFINANGDMSYYNAGAAAIAMYNCEHISIRGCVIHDNEDGIFGKSQGWESGTLRDIYVGSNTIYSNGRAGEDHYHNTYIEAVGTVYEFNYFGEPVAGSLGLNVKDRSAGLIFRYNYVEAGNTLLDLVEPEDGGLLMVNDPLFGKTFVYGNILYNPEGKASAIVHFGGDTGVVEFYQRHLYFYCNTVVNENDQSSRWRTILFDCPTNDQTVYADNNILCNVAATPGARAGLWCIGETDGTFVMGANWINNGYLDFRDGWPPEGQVYGHENLITGDEPGFIDLYNSDFRLADDSPCRYAARAMNQETANHPVEIQTVYDGVRLYWTARPSITSLGAME